MILPGFGRSAITSLIIGAMLAGCGGSQPPIGVPSAMPQTAALATHADRGKSGSGDLLYVSSPDNNTYLFSWPSGKPMGQLNYKSYNVCSDTNGNVWVLGLNATTLYEYAHGDTSPINTLTLPDKDGGLACSVDPTTGNLAVVIACQSSCSGNVALFAQAQGQPTLYETPFTVLSCGYDNQGNLFVGGFADASGALAELPYGGSSFATLSVSEKHVDQIGEGRCTVGAATEIM
jgi:hypothetical protein